MITKDNTCYTEENGTPANGPGDESVLDEVCAEWDDAFAPIPAVENRSQTYSSSDYERAERECIALSRALTILHGWWPLSYLKALWRHGMPLRTGQGVLGRLLESDRIEAIGQRRRRRYRLRDAMGPRTTSDLMAILENITGVSDRERRNMRTDVRNVARIRSATEPKRPFATGDPTADVQIADLFVVAVSDAEHPFISLVRRAAHVIAVEKGKTAAKQGDARHKAAYRSAKLLRLLIREGYVLGNGREQCQPPALDDSPNATPWEDVRDIFYRAIKSELGPSATPYGALIDRLFCILKKVAGGRADLDPTNATADEWTAVHRHIDGSEESAEEKAKLRSGYRKIYSLDLLAPDAPRLESKVSTNAWTGTECEAAARGDWSAIQDRYPQLVESPYGLRNFQVARMGSGAQRSELGLPESSVTQLYGDRPRGVTNRSRGPVAAATFKQNLYYISALVTFFEEQYQVDFSEADLRSLCDEARIAEYFEHRWGGEKIYVASRMAHFLGLMSAPFLVNVAITQGDQKAAKDLLAFSKRMAGDESSYVKRFKPTAATKTAEREMQRKRARESVLWAGNEKPSDSYLNLLRAKWRLIQLLLERTGSETLDDLVQRVTDGCLEMDRRLAKQIQVVEAVQKLIGAAERPHEFRFARVEDFDTIVNSTSTELVRRVSPWVQKNGHSHTIVLAVVERVEHLAEQGETAVLKLMVRQDTRITALYERARPTLLGNETSSYYWVPNVRSAKKLKRDFVARRDGAEHLVGPGVYLSKAQFRAFTKRILRSIQRVLQLPTPPRWDLYLIRHCVGSWFYNAVAPIAAQKLLGHRSLSTTATYYDGIYAEDLDYASASAAAIERVLVDPS